MPRCLVPAEPFAELVQSFLRRWNREHPQIGNQFGSSDDVTPIRGLAWLAGASGLAESTIENVHGRRYEKISLRVADSLATALERPDVLWDPRVADAVDDCCGGSSTATLRVTATPATV